MNTRRSSVKTPSDLSIFDIIDIRSFALGYGFRYHVLTDMRPVETRNGTPFHGWELFLVPLDPRLGREGHQILRCAHGYFVSDDCEIRVVPRCNTRQFPCRSIEYARLDDSE